MLMFKPSFPPSLAQWQRIAISRAFMRAQRPEVELILLDEPVSVVVVRRACRDTHRQT